MGEKNKIGFIYDFDLTLSEEYQQMPLFRGFSENIKKEYGIEPEDYFRVLCKGTDIGVGSLEQMLNDVKKGIFPGLTNRIMADVYGPKIELANGLSDWFDRINKKVEHFGYEASHHVVSAGCVPFVEGTSIAGYFDSIRAGKYQSNEEGIFRIRKVVEPNNKSSEIVRICKGTEDIDKDIPYDDYEINYNRVIIFGDGESDRRMFKFIRERGGSAIGVYGLNGIPSLQDTKGKLDQKVNYILPRDYSEGTIMDKTVDALIVKISERTCEYNFADVRALNLSQLKDKGQIDLTSKHLSSCDDCQERSWPTITF